MEKPYFITIINTPEKGDIIKPQYFSDICEIRANMTGTTGTGKLIATAPGADKLTRKEVKEFGKYVEYLQKGGQK